MVSINTNLSSLIVQNNLQQSTNALNLAIERMTTGFKINHAADNAAGYSISQNMSSQISSYGIAQDNIAMGLDMVTTAQDSISLMQSHGDRIMALWNQAQNGTYGDQSLQAIQSEVNARMAEIERLYNTTEYNGISLLGYDMPDWAQEVKANAGANISTQSTGFIDDIVTVTPDVIVTDPTQLASAISSNSKIGIGDAATLRKLAELVNSGTDCSGKTIILTDDIDLNNEEWTAIGSDSSHSFKGTFDGQGHKVKNLKIDKEGTNYQGLFGYAGSVSALKNVGVENVNIKGGNNTGGLAGRATTITNSYATGSVTGSGDKTGGLAGNADAITNSYATGSVTGGSSTGGLAGSASTITNSYATGSVSGGQYTGGLAGVAQNTITNSYATGNVSGTEWVGGLVGQLLAVSSYLFIHQSILSSGTVSGDSKVGSLIGGIVNTSNGTSFSTINITNASAVSQGNMIGFEGKSDGTGYTSGQMDKWLAHISSLGKASTTLQVGINGDESCQITFSSKLNLDLNVSNIKSTKTYDSIKAFLDQLSGRATQLGAVSNRLESALESTGVAMENLVSSRSTLRDADIAKESSAYIKSQILQQASATLLATANQAPSVALSLI